MITLEEIFGSENADLVTQIRAQDRAYARDLLDRLTKPLPTQHVTEWCLQNVKFNEPKFSGPFSTHTRHYLEEPLNLWRRDLSNDITDLICCWATRSAKTRIPMAGMAYRIALDPVRCLWTKPMKHGAGGSRNDAITKFIPMLKASPGLETAVERCDKNSLNGNQQRINGSIVDWEGTGSAKQLSGNPDDVVVQDECDGYVLKGHTEAHPSILADERTKDASNPLRYKSCSPTVEDGVIWQWLMRSDLRRRFLPCPRCNPEAKIINAETQSPPSPAEKSPSENNSAKLSAPLRLCVNFTGWFVLAWSEQFSVLPTKMPDGTPIPTAYIKWDPAAKNREGTWDLERVTRTAHAVCPHCQGKIHNHEKEWMDEHGLWLATKKGAPGVAGFQLSSLYVTHDETAWGILAKKFLMARDSGQTMKGFINNDLAEVDVMQEHGRNKIELSAAAVAQTDWVAQLTADFQKNWPYLWFVVRKWCAFKLLPPFPITNGLPDFVPELLQPGNEGPLEKCARLLGCSVRSVTAANFTTANLTAAKYFPMWTVIAELNRFDSRTGSSPLIEFLLAQNIVGEKLVKLYRETANSNTLDFRKAIFELMARQDGRTARCPRGGDSELIAAGHLALSGEYVWEELKELIQQYQIGHGMPLPGRCVAIDCGYAEKFNREVLRKCHESATTWKYYDPMSKNRPAIFYREPIHNYCVPAGRDGWYAMKGYPINQRWNHGGIRNELNTNLEDPFFGTVNAGTAVTEVLEFPQGLFWLRKEDLRQKRAKQTYTVSPAVDWHPVIHNPDGTPQIIADRNVSNFKTQDYERQLNEQYYDEMKGKVEPKHGRGGAQSRAHPYHLDDCETMQIALATHHEFFEENEPK